MKIKKKHLGVGFFVFLLLLLTMSGTIMSQVNEPAFKVIEAHENIEIREYSPIIVAQVVVEGERKEAISQGFRILADYIFGNNAPGKSISMTAPVMQQQGQEIAMTAPVMQQSFGDKGRWMIRFVMPAEYTLETLPQPNNKQIEIISVPVKRYAVIRFSGFGGTDSLEEHLVELRTFLDAQKIQALGDPIFAFYNPPWTLPFFRRNEVMLEVKKEA